MRPIICRRGRAETKGKIERPFQYVEGNLLCGREFHDLDDLRACARWWMREKSDIHLQDTTGRPSVELFLEQELSALTPLPLHSYDFAEVALRICDLEGYIEFETNRYHFCPLIATPLIAPISAELTPQISRPATFTWATEKARWFTEYRRWQDHRQRITPNGEPERSV